MSLMSGCDAGLRRFRLIDLDVSVRTDNNELDAAIGWFFQDLVSFHEPDAEPAALTRIDLQWHQDPWPRWELWIDSRRVDFNLLDDDVIPRLGAEFDKFVISQTSVCVAGVALQIDDRSILLHGQGAPDLAFPLASREFRYVGGLLVPIFATQALPYRSAAPCENASVEIPEFKHRADCRFLRRVGRWAPFGAFGRAGHGGPPIEIDSVLAVEISANLENRIMRAPKSEALGQIWLHARHVDGQGKRAFAELGRVVQRASTLEMAAKDSSIAAELISDWFTDGAIA